MRSETSLGAIQDAAGLASFLGFRGLTLTGLRAVAGLMLSGLPRLTDVTSVEGSGLKYTRHSGLNWDFFWIMQTVMRSTSGTYSPHSRIASGVQACCCSGE